MYKIIEKRQLSADVFYARVEAPDIAKNRKAGQFVLVQLDTEYAERIPLTIADADPQEGWIALVFQAVGATTIKMSRLHEGDELGAVLGPLGNPTHIEKKDTLFVSEAASELHRFTRLCRLIRRRATALPLLWAHEIKT